MEEVIGSGYMRQIMKGEDRIMAKQGHQFKAIARLR